MKNKLIVGIKLMILIFFFCWLLMGFYDYFRVRRDLDPLFCLSEKTNDYLDGSNYICTGMGYKMIRYNRSCLSATEFGPFLLKERKCE